MVKLSHRKLSETRSHVLRSAKTLEKREMYSLRRGYTGDFYCDFVQLGYVFI